MACLLFTPAAGVQPSLVAYRGTGQALNDLIGGHVDFFCEQVVSVAPQIAAGTIKAYGVSSGERLAPLPNVPTAKEAGLNYQMSIWAGIFAPKGTPKGIIDKLAAALDQALDDPGVQTRLADLGGSLPTKDERTPAKFDSFVKAEIARWSPILKAANLEAKCCPGCHAASATRLPKACAEGVICRHRPAASELRSKPVDTRKRRWLLARLLRYSPRGLGNPCCDTVERSTHVVLGPE